MLGESKLDRRVWADIIEANSSATKALGTLSPIWAVIISYAMSGPVPALGVTPWSVSIWWVLLTVAASSLRICFEFGFHKAKKTPDLIDVRFWLVAFAVTSSLTTVAWATGFWFFYEEGNTANLFFLMALMMASITQATVLRSNHFPGALAVILPAVIIPAARLIGTGDQASFIVLFMFPAWVGLILLHVRRTSKDIVKTYRMRYELEEMATQLGEARDEALRQRALAEEANASKSAFLANMSHELRTPLNAILGFSEIISTDALGATGREKYQGYAGDILSSGQHLLTLINGLLDIAKIEAGRLELSPDWMDVNETIADCLKLVEGQASSTGLDLSFEPMNNPWLYADERAFRQVLVNLLSNAVKFTPAGGIISVFVEDCVQGRTLVVEDTGVGIPDEAIGRLFRPFEQLENDYSKFQGGTGLGLALVKALAEMHGGGCELVSMVGEGTRVSVSFPHEETAERGRGPDMGEVAGRQAKGAAREAGRTAAALAHRASQP